MARPPQIFNLLLEADANVMTDDTNVFEYSRPGLAKVLGVTPEAEAKMLWNQPKDKRK